MARITVEDCLSKLDNRFELVILSAQRARDIHSGVTPTIDRDNDKDIVIALREIAQTSVSIEDLRLKVANFLSKKNNLIQESLESEASPLKELFDDKNDDFDSISNNLYNDDTDDASKGSSEPN